ncbi:hypothetical protein H6G76_15210 [Nostoc sp. FACHB-152]|uniref:hypothetical protein n=1 Tax=unclassified Nostoc TaxID=2593658 RepID=UPI001684E2D2|nr:MULTISPECIES: hypothetical protein [unclassified Nostoc]MBD2448479.1 hypothetical protein [Nostoc sp. FACHB-152]MBD2466216.1 hypothetical protein [Nostoc sp. FACHB-145]
MGIFALGTLRLLSNSIKLSLTEFYIHQSRENVTEPTDAGLGREGESAGVVGGNK